MVKRLTQEKKTIQRLKAIHYAPRILEYSSSDTENKRIQLQWPP